ncbi:MAG TPA: flagellar biosynthesis protein FliQ [Geminicoccaceae bacterium]|nr:flagellar biosynthesis protein FliQ [Geminicoccus sp.]HMU49164.1 flagellar biosynthesis protein FliQ [Geminicoccaceae bacterium]
MTPQLVLDVAREAIWVMIKIGAPTMLVALLVGLLVSLLQALTQIQEATLAFVPKVLAIAVTFVLTTPFVIHVLAAFTTGLFGRIATIGAS